MTERDETRISNPYANASGERPDYSLVSFGPEEIVQVAWTHDESPEFRIRFADPNSFEATRKTIIERVVEIGAAGYSARSDWISTSEATLFPHSLADLLPPDARIVVCPASQYAVEAFLAAGIDASGGVIEFAPDMLPEPREVEQGSLLFVDGETRVQDRGPLGVAIHFRHEGSPSTKWFLDGAATQIREISSKRSVIASFVARQIDQSDTHSFRP